MTKKLLFVVTLMLVVAFALMAADITGKWIYEQPEWGGAGSPPSRVTLDLKADGANLTGTITGGTGGRRGGTPPAREISDGKVDGNHISFTVKVDFNGRTMSSKYEGTVSGDELKLKATRDTPNGVYDDEMTAKRSTP
jgi:hypothetical protein